MLLHHIERESQTRVQQKNDKHVHWSEPDATTFLVAKDNLVLARDKGHVTWTFNGVTESMVQW
jgi:hypothetical protein